MSPPPGHFHIVLVLTQQCTTQENKQIQSLKILEEIVLKNFVKMLFRLFLNDQ